MNWAQNLEPGRKTTRMMILTSLLMLIFTGCAEESPQAPTATPTTMAMTDSDASAGMDEMDHMHEGDHEHDGTGREWEGTPPALELRVDEGPDGLVAVLEADGFTFTDPSNEEHVPGFGHTHVYVDGRLEMMSYDAAAPLGELDPGTHHIEVTLASGDHADYLVDGETLGVATMVEVAGEVEPAALAISIGLSGGTVDVADDRYEVARHGIVELTVMSDIAEEVHVHGYDIRRTIEAGVTTTMRFPADIPGVFEVELEDSGLPLFELIVE